MKKTPKQQVRVVKNALRWNICHWILRVIVATLILPQCSAAETVRGKVIGVSDGDTLTLLLDTDTTERVRLFGIDCPEKNQPYGKKAKQFTSRQVFGKVVELERFGSDRYGRTIGMVYPSRPVSLNEALLMNGLAWHYRKYSADRRFAELENQARHERLGLWTDPSPIPPWQWRKAKQKKVP